MGIEKAIEVLQDAHDYDPVNIAPLFADALALGIEALKCIQRTRSGVQRYTNTVLWGETEE